MCRGCYWWRNLLTFQMTFSIRRSVQVPRLSLCGADSTSHQSNVNSQFGTLLCLEVPGVSLYWRRGGLWVIRRSSFHSVNTYFMHPRPGIVSTFWRRSLHSAPCLTEMCHCSWERTNCSCHWCWVCSLSKWNIWSLVNRVKRRCPTTCCFNPGVLTLAGVCLWRSSALSKLLIGLILVLHQNLFSLQIIQNCFCSTTFENISPLISTETTEAQIQSTFCRSVPRSTIGRVNPTGTPPRTARPLTAV